MDTKTKYLLIGLGAVAVGTGGYFLFKHLQSQKDDGDIEAFKEQVSAGDSPVTISPQKTVYTPTTPKTTSSSRGYVPAPANSVFPLKMKSKGTLVKDVQLALIKKYGASILPKYGADGFYGTEMETALVSKGYPKVIDSATYAKIVVGNTSSTPSKTGSKTEPEINSKTIAKLLHTAIEKDDIFKAIAALKKIMNAAKYSRVNEEFKKKKIGWVSKTIVTALNDKFNSLEYKKKLNTEFHRMGLKYDGKHWSLSGFENTGKLLKTIIPATVWDSSGRKAIVPKQTVIGHYLRAANGITEFETFEGRTLFVKTTTISYAS